MAHTGLGQAGCHGLGTEWAVLTNEVSEVESRKYLEEEEEAGVSRAGLCPFPPPVAGRLTAPLGPMRGPTSGSNCLPFLGLGPSVRVWGSGEGGEQASKLTKEESGLGTVEREEEGGLGDTEGGDKSPRGNGRSSKDRGVGWEWGGLRPVQVWGHAGRVGRKQYRSPGSQGVWETDTASQGRYSQSDSPREIQQETESHGGQTDTGRGRQNTPWPQNLGDTEVWTHRAQRGTRRSEAGRPT